MRDFDLLVRQQTDNALANGETNVESIKGRPKAQRDFLREWLIERMARADTEGLVASLVELHREDFGLYTEAMRALQLPFGNQGVNEQHERIRDAAATQGQDRPGRVDARGAGSGILSEVRPEAARIGDGMEERADLGEEALGTPDLASPDAGTHIDIDLGAIVQHLFQEELSRLAGALGLRRDDVHIYGFFRALGSVVSRIKQLLEALVLQGDIAAINLDTDSLGKDPFGTYINIPHLMEGYSKGPSDDAKPWAIGMAVRKGISTFLDVPKSHTGGQSGYDYGAKFDFRVKLRKKMGLS